MAQDDPVPIGATRIPLSGGTSDLVVVEAPLVLEVGGGRVITMRTPMGESPDLDWAVGFLASEGVIAEMADVVSIAWVGVDPQVDQAPAIADSVVARLRDGIITDGMAILSRTHEMRPSCGICGVDSPQALVSGFPKLNRSGPVVSPMQAAELLERLTASQPLFRATGGCHGAGIFSPTGELLAVAEDIGRHNALDRAIGQCLRKGISPNGAVLALSGRAGYELIVKALRVGIHTIASVGAASSFAVALAQAANARLLGFVKEDGEARVYSD